MYIYIYYVYGYPYVNNLEPVHQRSVEVPFFVL